MNNGPCFSKTKVNKVYYPFGMVMPNRSYAAGTYRFGFNGKENDNEVKGAGNEQDYGMRIYDTRLGRFLSVDPIFKDYPELTTYQFASNTPLQAIDLDGLEAWKINRDWNSSDLFNYGEFIKSESNRIYSKVDAGEISRNTCFDCADLAVHMYIQYAAANGLPVSFTSNRNGKVLDSSDPNLITYNESDPSESIQSFENIVRSQTSAKSLKLNDLKSISRIEAVPGDVITLEGLHIDIIRPLNNGESEHPTPYIATVSGTTDYRNPMYGVIMEKARENVNSYTEAYDNSFYRFKEMFSASKKIDKLEPKTVESLKLNIPEMNPVPRN